MPRECVIDVDKFCLVCLHTATVCVIYLTIWLLQYQTSKFEEKQEEPFIVCDFDRAKKRKENETMTMTN